MAQGVKVNYNIDTIKEFIKQGKTTKQVSEHYGVHRASICRMLKRDKVYFPGQRKIVVDHNFFETIDTELKAYLLGFFIADGCVYDSNRIGLCIAEQDEYIVNLFAQSIAPLSFIKKIHNTKGAKARQPQLVVRISSPKLVSDLAKLGVFPRKTYIPMYIPNVSDDLKWHFIRGYFDGDGCIHLIGRKVGYSIKLDMTNGDKTILEDIQKFTGLGKIREKHNYNCWSLPIDHTAVSSIFLNKLYNNSYYKMPRKFNKYLIANTEVSN